MKAHIVGCVLASLFVLGTSASGQVADREVLLGAVHKDTVLAVPKVEVKRPIEGPPVAVLQGPLQVEPGKAYASKRYEFTQGVLCNQPYRWRVVGNMFWGSGSTGARQLADHVKRIPMQDWPVYDRTNAKRDEQYGAKYPEDKYFDGEIRPAHSWGAGPVGVACVHRPLAPGDVLQPPVGQPFLPTSGVFFDVYPSADNKRLRLFVLDQDQMRVWDGTAKRGIDAYWIMDWGNEEKEVERFASPFKEAFTVFVRDKDYYFVTEYGDVYLSRPPAEKQERKVEKVWDGRRQPVHALITDAGTDKVWCFVEPFFTDKPDEERVYFELSAKPDPKPYKLKKIEKPKIDEPLKSVLEYAHVLQADKKIK